MLGLHALELRLNFPNAGKKASGAEELWKIRCLPTDGVEEDFLGNKIPREGALPGPFQNVSQGLNRWLLWPVRPLLRGYPLQAGEAPHITETFNERVRIGLGCTGHPVSQSDRGQ